MTMSINNKELVQKLIESAEIKISLKNDSFWLATAKLVIGGLIEIRGWRISKSKYEGNGLWIQPPSYGVLKGKSLYCVWINDKELSNLINKKIDEAYTEALINKETEKIDA